MNAKETRRLPLSRDHDPQADVGRACDRPAREGPLREQDCDDGADLHQFCASVRTETAPPGRLFITPLDDLFFDAHGPAGNLESTLRRGDVIEVQGPAGCGKTAMLLFFAMTAVLPDVWAVTLRPDASSPPRKAKVALGGKGKAVAWFDCDGRFSALRLRHVLRSHLHARVEATVNGCDASDEDYEALLSVCLARVHVFTPLASTLAVTLLSLPVYHRTCCPDDEIVYLVIDSLSAFHWQDLPMIHFLKALSSVRDQLGCVTFIANWVLHSTGPTAVSAPPRQHLAPPYPSPFTSRPSPLELAHHLTLHRPSACAYPAGTRLEAARTASGERTQAVEKRNVVVTVRSLAADRWLEMGRCELGIRRDGIEA